MSEEWHKTHAVLLKSVAESQGKLLAGINALETRLALVEQRLTSLCTGIGAQVGNLGDEVTADMAKLYNGHALALTKIGELIDAWNELMKLRPAPRSTKRKPRGRRK
jgi:hypothetical protein